MRWAAKHTPAFIHDVTASCSAAKRSCAMAHSKRQSKRQSKGRKTDSRAQKREVVFVRIHARGACVFFKCAGSRSGVCENNAHPFLVRDCAGRPPDPPNPMLSRADGARRPTKWAPAKVSVYFATPRALSESHNIVFGGAGGTTSYNLYDSPFSRRSDERYFRKHRTEDFSPPARATRCFS